MVPEIQRDIDNYYRHSRNNNRIGVGNFKVVPIHSFRMKYISIDSTMLAHMLAFLNIAPKKQSAKNRGKEVNISIKEFIADRS